MFPLRLSLVFEECGKEAIDQHTSLMCSSQETKCFIATPRGGSRLGSPLATATVFHFFIFSFQQNYVNGIMYCANFWDWLS